MKAKWIWYPGDFSLALFNKTMIKRYERDVPIPPFWRMDYFYPDVKFYKKVDLSEAEEIEIGAEGLLAVQVDGVYCYGVRDRLMVEKGEHLLTFWVYNSEKLPCLYVRGRSIVTDESWMVSCNDHHDKFAESWNFDEIGHTPNDFSLETRPVKPVGILNEQGKKIYDFGKEMMAYVRLGDIRGKGKVSVYYGESLEEAADWEHCELTDTLNVTKSEEVTSIAKAFRYLCIDGEPKVGEVQALFEYLPIEAKSSFRCDDARLNAIYDTALYTLHLNMREFFLDGIKRDRWVWGGDACQSYLMNFYSYFDVECVKRTMYALAGKEPYKTHINHIMDYTFYWIISAYDVYMFTQSERIVELYYEKVKGLLEFCIGRTNARGLMEGYPQDWVFVDWADIDNTGEVCVEQMLYYISLRRGAIMAGKAGDAESQARWNALAEDVYPKLEQFWDEEREVYVHSCKGGERLSKVTRYAAIFAVLYDLCGEERKEKLVKNVLLNDGVQKLKTPYMRFYELAALCKAGRQDIAVQEICSYWGGMLDEGATTFWELYNPAERGPEKYAMYGRRYGKSLCHSWGASPLYLLGRYFAGCRPMGDGTYEVKPCLVGMKRMKMTVPTVQGSIEVDMNGERLCVTSDGVCCHVIAYGRTYELKANESVTLYREGGETERNDIERENIGVLIV